MDKRNERTALLAAVVTGLWIVADFALARITQLRVLPVLLPYSALTLVIAGVVYLRERFSRRTEEDKRDAALATTERVSGSIFDEQTGDEPFSIAQTRQQFERFVVPAIAPLLAIGLAAWVWSLYRQLQQPVAAPEQRLLAAAFLAGQAFTTFLFSRYLLGIKMRGPGIALGVMCIAALLAGAATLAGEMGYPPADRFTALTLVTFTGILAIENFINFLAELYRPRRRGGEFCQSYESRLGGLLTEPGAWARNIAGALDYQFGFKVSDTWLFHFLETALLPLVIFQLVALYLLSCLVFLAPEEAGILEHFGKPVAQLTSGAHLKLPWPFETVRRFPVNRVLSFRIGQGQAGQVEPSVIVWSIPHVQGEEQFLVAAPRSGTDTNTVPVNLVAFNIPVEYQITNVFAFAYNHADATRLIEQIAYRSLTQEAAARDLFNLMGDGQTRIANSLRQRIQTETDHRQLGVEIKFVGLQGVHPPTQVAEAFESVIGALEQKEANILAAHAAAGRTVALAAANSTKATLDAAGYRAQRTEISTAEAHRFLILAQTASKSPRVFRTNLYLGVLADALADTRKYIVPASAANEVIQINFEEKLRPELFDLGTEKKEK